jgi:sporulation protein YlmC with PRC-barrel domain
MGNKVKRLQELSGSGYEVAKGQPDIRGWEVRDTHGQLIGKVHELVFDSRANKVRYMVVNVNDSKELQLEKRSVIVPIGLAVLEHKNDDVIIPNVTPFQLRALPRYQKDDLGTRAEHAISTVFGRTDTKVPATYTDDEDVDENFYNNDMFNENNMYSRREKSANTTNSDKRQDGHHLNEAEAASLKKDSDIYPTNSSSLNPETEEEYLRRRRKENDLRD